MTADVFTIDTNVLLYAFASRADRRHDQAASLLRRARESGRCILTLQTLADLFHVLTRKSMASGDRARMLVQELQETFAVVAADAETLADAMDAVRDHQWAFRDAMIWATARKAGCEVILSEDGQDGRRLMGVTVVNPFTDPAPAVLNDLLA